MQSAQKAKLQQCINLLQQVLGGSGGSSETVIIEIEGLDAGVNKFNEMASHLEPQLQQLTKILCDSINLMQAVLNHSSSCPKYDSQTEQSLKQKFLGLSRKAEDLGFKSRDFQSHAKAIKEMLGVTFWVFSPMPEVTVKGAIEAADFNALKFQRQKNLPHNDWYRAILDTMKIFEVWVKKNFPSGLIFNMKGEGNWNDLLDGAPIVSHKGDSGKKQQVQEKEAPKAPVKKAPTKQLQGINWFIGHFQKENTGLNDGQVQMKNGIFIEHCHGCLINIEGKFKSLQMNICSDVTLIVNSCLSGVEVMNCKNLKVIMKGKIPSISIDKSQKVRVLLKEDALGSDIVTTKVSEFGITLINENDEEGKDHYISEQLITKWNPEKKKFETQIYDKFI